MRTNQCLLFVCLFGLLTLMGIYGQEGEINVEESAEVFLEEYSDEFQETFFEALKQKGIENYDRAINLLLECKNLDDDNKVIDHELAKAYFEIKQYMLANEYALNALNSEPENLWYMSIFTRILQRQGRSITDFVLNNPNSSLKQKENLALVLYRQNRLQESLNILKGIKKSSFTDNLIGKIDISLKRKNKREVKNPNKIVKETITKSPFNLLKDNIENLILVENYSELLEVSSNAVENFPSQPFFYFANGLALQKTSKNKAAIEVLEMGLDLLIDDVQLANKFHKELANTYLQLGNVKQANMYLSKIKPGL